MFSSSKLHDLPNFQVVILFKKIIYMAFDQGWLISDSHNAREFRFYPEKKHARFYLEKKIKSFPTNVLLR